jgi:hypothetical protein
VGVRAPRWQHREKAFPLLLSQRGFEVSKMTIHRAGPNHDPSDVKVGDHIDVYSRAVRGWVARLEGSDREWLIGSKRQHNHQVIYTYEITMPGRYQVGGNEFGKFSHIFKVVD